MGETISVTNHLEAVNSYTGMIETIEANYNDKGKLEAYETMSTSIGQQLNEWAAEVEAESKKIDDSLAALKPQETEPNLDKVDVGILNFYSNELQSRIAAEGHNRKGFLGAVEGLAGHHNDKMRQAFVHNFYQILKTAKEMFPEVNQDEDDRDKSTRRFAQGTDQAQIVNHLRKLYKEAQDSLKTPEQKKYEEALAEAENKKQRLQSNLSMAQQHFNRMKHSIDSKLKGW